MNVSKRIDVNKPITCKHITDKPITYKPKHAIVQDLIDFINRRTPIINTEQTKTEPLPDKCDRLKLFNSAIATAIAQGEIAMRAEGIEDLDTYLEFTDRFIEWTPTVDSPRDEVLQKILVFYWPFNQQELSDLQTPINPRFTNTDLRWLSYWLVAYARRLGEYMATPESVGNIWSFYTSDEYGQGPGADQDTKYNMGHRYKQWRTPDGGWKSFNQFFSREWDDMDYSRPLDGRRDDSVIVHAADSVFNGNWDIKNGIVHIDQRDTESSHAYIDVKGIDWPINDLVRTIDGSETYHNGSFMHAFLGPTDYHRQHAPVEGKVVRAKNIQEQVYLQVESITKDGKTTISPVRHIMISPRELQRRKQNTEELENTTNSESQKKLLARYREINNLEANQSEQPSANGPKPDEGITAPDKAGYQWNQTRGIIVIDTSYDSRGRKKAVDNGLVAVLPIGMAQVSSVVITVKEGEYVEKGQNISYFQFGGSDIVTVFQKRPTYRDDLIPGTTKLHIREKLAEWK
jgi:phosphatidylserine decarboxylase